MLYFYRILWAGTTYDTKMTAVGGAAAGGGGGYSGFMVFDFVGGLTNCTAVISYL